MAEPIKLLDEENPVVFSPSTGSNDPQTSDPAADEKEADESAP